MSDKTSKHDPSKSSQGEGPGAVSAVDLPEVCVSFRSEVLEGGAAGVLDGGAAGVEKSSTHESACGNCRRWAHGVRVVAQSLRSPLLDAPDVLAQRVSIELEEPAAHLARAFGRLEPRVAPAQLDQAVEHLFSPLQNAPDLEAWELDSPTVKSLRGLRAQPTPPVLDRLVEEELQGSEEALSSRYIGRLSHLTAPDELARRLIGSRPGEGKPTATDHLGTPLRRGRSMVPAIGGLLAAAALLMIMGLQRKASHPEVGQGSSWAFEVVVIEDARNLDPQAAAMLSALMGASLPGELGHLGEAQ
ncbi:MAG: hypothetical protein ACI8QS_001820 [Planctomycetota bacterium]|jgi:hypothetical protein